MQVHQHEHIGGNMETKLTGLAIGRLDAAYESVMTEYNTRKGFLSAQSFMLPWIQCKIV